MPNLFRLNVLGNVSVRNALGRTRHRQSQLRVLCVALGVFLASVMAPVASRGQDNEVSERERITAERFLTVLIRRPRPGTALDRVIEFHQRSGSIDTLLDALVVDDGQPDAGPKAMIAGLVQLRQGNSAAAAKQFARASRLMPEDSVASFQHGIALLQIGELDQAADAIRESITRKPSRAEAMQVYTKLAQLYARAGDRSRSLEVWNQLQQEFPSDEKVASRIAEEVARGGDAEEARRRFLSLADSARREEDKLRFAVRAAEMLRTLDRSDEALRELTAALAKTRPGSWLYRDIVLRIENGFTVTGDYEGLAAHYQKQIDADPDNINLPLRLARIWINLGRLSDAEEVARETLKKTPDSNEVRQSLVDVLQASGNYAEAATVQRDMLRSDPDNTDILFALATTLASDPVPAMEVRQERA
ncbi:MAG: tetratricopeptide repeat protein, partial [Planctomycetota bacterium]